MFCFKLSKLQRLALIIVLLANLFILFFAQKYISAAKTKAFQQTQTKNQNDANHNQVLDHIVMDEQDWLIQFKVLQKTAIIVRELDDSLTIETLMFLAEANRTFTKSYVETSLRCICNFKGELVFLKHFEYSYQESDVYLWRFKFKIPAKYRDQFFDAKIAVVDYKDYNLKKLKFGSDLIVLYHQPMLFSKKDSKIPGVASCVHTIGGLKRRVIKRLANWVRIQRELNIAGARLYFTFSWAVEWPDVKEIPTKSEFMDAKLVKYKVEISENCDWIEKMSNQSSSKYLPVLYKECADLNQKFLQISNDPNEKMCDNDCYLKSRYKYEYVTNYDFDEIIFPRRMEINDYSVFANISSCSGLKPIQRLKYNLYDYIRSLHTRYEREENKKIAALHFEHYLAVSSSANFFEIVKSSDNQIHLLLNGRDIFITVTDSEEDQSLLKSYEHVLDLIDCLFKRDRFTYFDYVWSSPFLLRVDDRFGKSVYITDHTEMINPHGPEERLLMPNTLFKKVPIQDGFTSHYRSSGMDHFPFNFSISSGRLRFELEFYMLLREIELQGY